MGPVQLNNLALKCYRLMINKDNKKNRVRPMADSNIKTSSPMTFNHFRYDVRKKRKKKEKKIAIVVVFPSVLLTKGYDI